MTFVLYDSLEPHLSSHDISKALSFLCSALPTDFCCVVKLSVSRFAQNLHLVQLVFIR